jgi:hypothetical protein
MPLGGGGVKLENRKVRNVPKARRLVLKKDTVRVLDGKEAKGVIGGRATSITETLKTMTVSFKSDCCKTG